MYKYLFLILFGIILFLYNNVEGFSIGGQDNINCPQWIENNLCYQETPCNLCSGCNGIDDCVNTLQSPTSSPTSPPPTSPPPTSPPTSPPPTSPPPTSPPPTSPPPTSPPPTSPTSPSPCLPKNMNYTNVVLDWSTNDNPYGRPMYDTSKSYIEQGICGTCIVYSIVSQLSCLYNIQLYEHIDNCENFKPIMISPRSILDILMRYKKFSYTTPNVSNKYNYNTDCSNYLNHRCGFTFLRDYDHISIYNSIKNLKESLKYLRIPHFYGHNFLENMNNNIILKNFKYPFPFIRNHSISNEVVYENFFQCPGPEKYLFNDIHSSDSTNQDYNYIDLFNNNDLIDFNLNNYTDILENEPLTISFDHYKNIIKRELINGPLCIGVYLNVNGQWDDDGKISIETNTNLEYIPEYGHAINIIGYNDNDDFIILSSFPTHRSFLNENVYAAYSISNFSEYKTNISINDFYNQFILLSRFSKQQIFKCDITIGNIIDPTIFVDNYTEDPQYNIPNLLFGISGIIMFGAIGLYACASKISNKRNSFVQLSTDQEPNQGDRP